MKKILFIDRDGTLIVEPPDNYQIDTLEKLSFIPGVISNLIEIGRYLDYELVMVTNQDGLGTELFPEDQFWPSHEKMMEIFDGENISFSEIFIDKTLPEENADTRKPGTGMLTAYQNGEYDLENSFVIGDRVTDLELAQNLGAKGIFLRNDLNQKVSLQEHQISLALDAGNWDEITCFLMGPARTATVERKTNETEIQITLDLDGEGKANISTGLGFFDHMLEQLSRHGGIDLSVTVKGDLKVDEHHTIEDTAIALGEAFNKTLGDKSGLARYGFCLPMDDCLAQVAIDFGGRNWIEWEAEFKREKIGEMPTEMFYHFFKSFTDNAKCNLNIKAEGKNEHHKIEAIFKAFAKSIAMAITRDKSNRSLPSTKGVL